ncbi:hypothetical protein JYQ62_19685 [Nostoc sp. UHCC 0702]|nr:hypothetical protein JYQ62_19685 [Nostoc sp. UHCC 0702]
MGGWGDGERGSRGAGEMRGMGFVTVSVSNATCGNFYICNVTSFRHLLHM